MLASERFIHILEELEHNGVITLQTICKQLNASESTIRRDFEELEKQKKLKRVHGGATKINLGTLTSDKELTMQQKSSLNVEAKKKLCQYCATLVQDGDCIFIDGGTTFMFLVDLLEGKRVKVVTHNNFVKIKEGSTLELIRVGGNYIPSYNMNIGSIALQTVEMFNYDYAFIGCAGIDVVEDKAYTAEMGSAQIKSAAMKCSLKNYLLVDATKMDTRGFYKFKAIKEFDGLIMDSFDSKHKKPKNLIIAE